MDESILLDADRTAARGTCLKLRYDILVKEFGALSASFRLPPVRTAREIIRKIPSVLRGEWMRAIAEELLLRHGCGIPCNRRWLQLFRDVSPFENGPPLRECMGLRCACGVFPLAGTRGRPGIGHVWIVEGLAGPARRHVNASNFVPSGYGLFFIATHSAWVGESWQLAARLALRCVQEKNASAAAELARKWLVTGTVKEAGIGAVRLDNKLELPSSRTWMIPLDNIKHLPASAVALTIRSAADENAAWAHITGKGVRSGSILPWPNDVCRLYIIIGGNIKASVASALFCPEKTRVTLWHSQNSKNAASATLLVLRQLRPDLELASPINVSSEQLVEAERAIRRVVEAEYDIKQKIIFNVTSGNFLMRLAVDMIARQYPTITLVYRDIDAPKYMFTRINYQQFPPEVGLYSGNPIHLAKLNANFLFDKTPYTAQGSPEDMARNFLSKCRKNC